MVAGYFLVDDQIIKQINLYSSKRDVPVFFLIVKLEIVVIVIYLFVDILYHNNDNLLLFKPTVLMLVLIKLCI